MLKIKEPNSPKWLKQKYWEEELTTIEIGNLLGCDAATILNRLKKFDIPRRKPGLHGRYEQYRNEKWLWEQIGKGRINKDIATELGMPIQIVSGILNKIGVYDLPYKNPEWLRDKFVYDGESIQYIAKTCGVEPRHVKHYINKYDLRQARSRHWNLELGI